MKSAVRQGTGSVRIAGLKLRCFLNAALLVCLGLGGIAKDYASTCPPPADMSLPRLQGTVYGPSGVPVPQILVRAERDGKVVGQTQTDDKGRFEFKVPPGNYNVNLQFLGSSSMDLNVRVGRGSGGFFRSPRMRIVLGLSGTKCNFATVSMKLFKNEIRRYQQRLVEVPGH